MKGKEVFMWQRASNGGGGGNATKVSSGETYTFGAAVWVASNIGVPVGEYITGTFDVSSVSSMTLKYLASASYVSTGPMGYKLDGVSTSMQYGNTSWSTLTVDLTNANKLEFFGNAVSGNIGRTLGGFVIFS